MGRSEEKAKEREAAKKRAAAAAKQKAEKEKAEKDFVLQPSSFGGLNLDSSTYRYPFSNAQIKGDTDYVTFEFFKYKAPFAGTGGKTKADEYSTSIDFTDSKNILGKKFGKNIIMYMPEDIQSEYGANWSGAGFGFLAESLKSLNA